MMCEAKVNLGTEGSLGMMVLRKGGYKSQESRLLWGVMGAKDG
jgi:hypothetical protein